MVVRGEKVILDSDLAERYGVETRRLNEQVRRNMDKFPKDFMFQLTKDAFAKLMELIREIRNLKEIKPNALDQSRIVYGMPNMHR